MIFLLATHFKHTESNLLVDYDESKVTSHGSLSLLS